MPSWAPRVAVAVALVALVGWSFVARWEVLADSPFPLGVDGYYYPIQLRALLDHGMLHYASAPVAFWLMAPLAAITDPIIGAKLGAALGGAVIALPAYAVGRRLGGGRVPGLVAAALATPSAGSAYLTIEFVKNSIGLTVALTALALVLRAIDRRTRVSIAIAVIAMVLAFATHKMAAGFVLVVAVPAAIVALRGRARIAAAAVAVVAVAAIGLAAPRGWLSADDARLARRLVSATPQWEAPALVQMTPKGPYVITFGDEPLTGEIAGVIALAILLRRRWQRRDPSSTTPEIAAWMVVALAVGIGFPWLAVDDPQGLAFRLRCAAFVPMALAGAIVAGAMIPWIARTVRGSIVRALATRDRARADSHQMSRLVARVLAIVLAPLRWVVPDLAGTSATALDAAAIATANAILAVVAIALALRVPGDRREGEVLVHPTLVASALAVRDHVPAGDTAVIPERHIEYMVAWYAGTDVSLRPEPVPRAHRWRLMPLEFIREGSALDIAITRARAEPSLVPPVGLHARLPNGLVLVAETTWEWIVDHLPPDEQARARRWQTR
jgi:hypothetical protein